MKGGIYTKEGSQSGADSEQASPGRSCRWQGRWCCTCGARDRSQREHLLPLASRVRWVQPRSGETTQEARARERPVEANDCRACSRQTGPQRGGRGKLLSPSRRRKCVERVQRVLPGVSERRACRVIEQPRATQRRKRVERICRREGLKMGPASG